MGYTRSEHRKTLVLPRGAYTNYGDPNYDYSFVTNGTGMSVQLKALANYEVGDVLRFKHRSGGIGFTVSSQGSNDIYNGTSSVGSASCGNTTPLELTVGEYIGAKFFIISSKQ